MPNERKTYLHCATHLPPTSPYTKRSVPPRVIYDLCERARIAAWWHGSVTVVISGTYTNGGSL